MMIWVTAARKLLGALVPGGGGALQGPALPLVFDLPPQLPGHPEQQDSARQQEADYGQQIRDAEGEDDAQHRGHGDADGDHLEPLFLGQAGRRHADDQGVVAGQDQIDDDHRKEGGKLRWGNKIKHSLESVLA